MIYLCTFFQKVHKKGSFCSLMLTVRLKNCSKDHNGQKHGRYDSPEDAHGSKGRHLHIGFVHKHRLEAGVRVATGQDLLVELKNLMKVRHGVFKQRQQLREAEMRDLKRREDGAHKGHSQPGSSSAFSLRWTLSDV